MKLTSALFLALTLHATAAPPRAVLERYCIGCHDAETKKGGLDLDLILGEDIAKHAAKIALRAAVRSGKSTKL